jgi:hypothetical protein
MLDPFNTSGSGRLMWISPFQCLDTGFLIDRENDFSPLFQFLGFEVEAYDVQHLGFKVGIGAVEPVMPAMRLDGRLVEESPHGGSADGLDDSVFDGGLSEVGSAPVGDGDTVFIWRPGGQSHNLMLLLRGKKSVACLAEGDP